MKLDKICPQYIDFHSCRGATQISQIIQMVTYIQVTAICEVKFVDLDMIEHS
jgi:hypothetical protein